MGTCLRASMVAASAGFSTMAVEPLCFAANAAPDKNIDKANGIDLVIFKALNVLVNTI